MEPLNMPRIRMSTHLRIQTLNTVRKITTMRAINDGCTISGRSTVTQPVPLNSGDINMPCDFIWDSRLNGKERQWN